MAYNGSGVYTPPAASFPAVASTLIESAKYNAVINDIATGLTTAITKDGQTVITANLPMATYRHTGVSNAAALTDYAAADQVTKNTLTYGGASAAGTDTYAVSLPISPAAYAAGQRFQFLADVANTGACTVNFNAIGAASIKLLDGSDPYNGAIQIGPVDVQYDGTNFVLLNPYSEIDSLAKTDGNFIVGAGSNFVVESGPTAQTSLGFITKHKEADEGSATTTLTDDSDLAGWPLDASSFYKVTGNIPVTCADSGVDFKGQFTYSGTVDNSGFALNAANGVGSSDHESAVINASSNITVSAGVLAVISISGSISTNSSGTLDFQWAQVSSSATNLLTKSGAWITVTKMN